jgi:hypothetical protein
MLPVYHESITEEDIARVCRWSSSSSSKKNKQQQNSFPLPSYCGSPAPKTLSYATLREMSAQALQDEFEREDLYQRDYSIFCQHAALLMKEGGVAYHDMSTHQLKIALNARGLVASGRSNDNFVLRLQLSDEGLFDGMALQIRRAFKPPVLAGGYGASLTELPHLLLRSLLSFCDLDTLFALLTTCKYIYSDCLAVIKQKAVADFAGPIANVVAYLYLRDLVNSCEKEYRFSWHTEQMVRVNLSFDERKVYASKNDVEGYCRKLVQLICEKNGTCEVYQRRVRMLRVEEKLQTAELTKLKETAQNRVEELNRFLREFFPFSGEDPPFLEKNGYLQGNRKFMGRNSDTCSLVYSELISVFLNNFFDRVEKFVLGKKLDTVQKMGLSMRNKKYFCGFMVQTVLEWNGSSLDSHYYWRWECHLFRVLLANLTFQKFGGNDEEHFCSLYNGRNLSKSELKSVLEGVCDLSVVETKIEGEGRESFFYVLVDMEDLKVRKIEGEAGLNEAKLAEILDVMESRIRIPSQMRRNVCLGFLRKGPNGK